MGEGGREGGRGRREGGEGGRSSWLFHVGLSLPKKRGLSNVLSKLPFASSELETTVIIERKQGLEKYLQVCVPLLL